MPERGRGSRAPGGAVVATARSGAAFLRRCACGGNHAAGERDACRQKREGSLRRSAVSAAVPSVAPQIVHEVLGGAGQPLDRGTRGFMESRFGHDFSRVRLHTGERAAESARAVGARAYTVGRDIVFGDGEFRPESAGGRLLLAHELAHVRQQSNAAPAPGAPLPVGASDATEEAVADRTAEAVLGGGTPVRQPAGSPTLSRKLVVGNPTAPIPNPGGKGKTMTNVQQVASCLSTLCPDTGLSVVKGGVVEPDICLVGQSLIPALTRKVIGCECLCDLVQSKNTITIVVDDAMGPGTFERDPAAAMGRTAGGSSSEIHIPSENAPKVFGASLASGTLQDVEPWLLLGHEMCGHAWLANSGRETPLPQVGLPSHVPAIDRENQIRSEHGIAARAVWNEPYCGEGFSHPRGTPTPKNAGAAQAKDPDFLKSCQAWRDSLNWLNCTRYTVADRIPLQVPNLCPAEQRRG